MPRLVVAAQPSCLLFILSSAPPCRKGQVLDDRERPDHDLMIQNQRVLQRREVPEDILGTLVFLLSADADFITGQTILVNGGIVMQ